MPDDLGPVCERVDESRHSSRQGTPQCKEGRDTNTFRAKTSLILTCQCQAKKRRSETLIIYDQNKNRKSSELTTQDYKVRIIG